MATPRNLAEKNAKHKLTLLQLSQKLGSVAQACRNMDYSRSQFYEIKRRFELEGFQGLIDRPPIPKSHPKKKSDETVAKVCYATRQHPGWGHRRIAAQLVLEGIVINCGTVRRIWLKMGMLKKQQRWLWAEQQSGIIELDDSQLQELERLNPCLKERHVESPKPGYLLCQDTFFVGSFKGIGRVYLQAVIDTFCSLGFAKLYRSKQAVTAADMLFDKVIPFYREEKIEIEHILTDNGSEYCGRPMEHPFQIMLTVHGIKHRRTKVATPRTNGFVERFNRTLLDEFFRGILLRKFYTSLEELQDDLDAWLHHYNHERPHLGYRNNGRTPWLSFKQQ
jgi:transposase InsO family protein